jgi:hypothetical protein
MSNCTAVSPDIQKHPIHFPAQPTSTLSFHHLNDTLLVEKIFRGMLEDPLEKVAFELFHEILFVRY